MLHSKPDQIHLGWVCFSFYWYIYIIKHTTLQCGTNSIIPYIQLCTYKNEWTVSNSTKKSDQQEHPLLGPEQESELHHLLSVRFQRGYWSSLFLWLQISDYKHRTVPKSLRNKFASFLAYKYNIRQNRQRHKRHMLFGEVLPSSLYWTVIKGGWLDLPKYWKNIALTFLLIKVFMVKIEKADMTRRSKLDIRQNRQRHKRHTLFGEVLPSSLYWTVIKGGWLDLPKYWKTLHWHFC